MPYGGTIFSTVNADLVQTDVDGIVQGLTGPAGMTLSDVQDRLNLGLFDPGMMPYLQMLQMDLTLLQLRCGGNRLRTVIARSTTASATTLRPERGSRGADHLQRPTAR